MQLVADDMNQLSNKYLAADPRYHGVKAQLKTRMAEFMEQQGDEGIATEMKAFDRQPRR